MSLSNLHCTYVGEEEAGISTIHVEVHWERKLKQ